MAEPSTAVKSARAAVARVKKSLEKDKTTAVELRNTAIPTDAGGLKALDTEVNAVIKTAREFLERFDGHIIDLEKSLHDSKIPADVIEAEIDPLGDYASDSVRWITRLELFAKELGGTQTTDAASRPPVKPTLRPLDLSSPGPSGARTRLSAQPSDDPPAGPSTRSLGLQDNQGGASTSYSRSQETPVFGLSAGTNNSRRTADPNPAPPNVTAHETSVTQTQIERLLAIYEHQQSSISGAAKLPQLELVKFDGSDPGAWSTFWDTFKSSVHERRNLRPVEKLKYLHNLLSGEALKTIAGLPIADHSYDAAVNLLKNQYGSPDTQISAIHAKLMQLKPVANDTKKLRSFYLEVESSLKCLEALQQETENPHFVSLILSKLPHALITQLERLKGTRVPWTVFLLRDYLNSEITVREASDRYKRTGEQDKEDPAQPPNTAPKPPTGSSLLGSETSKRQAGARARGCAFCQQQHWSDECPKFKTVEERKGQVKEKCFNCLGSNHRQKDCPSDRPCFYCKATKRHHRSLCPYQFPSAVRLTMTPKDFDPNRRQGAWIPPNQNGQSPNQAAQQNPPFGAPGTWTNFPNPSHATTPSQTSLATNPYPGSFMATNPYTSPVHWGTTPPNQNSSTPQSQPNPPNQPNSQSGNTGHPQKPNFNCVAANEQVYLQTASCLVLNMLTGKAEMIRALLDCASSRTYISEKLKNKLAVSATSSESMTVNRFASNKPVTVKTETVQIGIQLKDGSLKPITANVLPNITGNIAAAAIPERVKQLIPKTAVLADSHMSPPIPQPVDLLLGNDYYMDVTTGNRIHLCDGLYMVETTLGWVMSGRIEESDSQDAPDLQFVSYTATCLTGFEPPPLFASDLPVLKAQWEDMSKLETIGITEDPVIADDDLAVQQFEETVKLEKDRYVVSWPLKSSIAELPTNYFLALGRLKSLIRRLNDRPDLLEKVQAIIKDQLEKGMIEPVGPAANSERVHYIPHHPVETPLKTTTKVRIVYDASARASKATPSLNDCLLKGPLILQDLVTLLLRFQLWKVAVTADIEKAFLQVGLHPEDRNLTRFLWIKDPTKPLAFNNIQEFRFTRVPFGMTSSPFLLGQTVKHHLSLQTSDAATANKIKDNLYVDNLITGTHSPEEAKLLYRSAKTMFTMAGMNLREWLTNSRDVNASIESRDQAPHTGLTKILGLGWDSNKDLLIVQGPTQAPHGPITKRKILGFTASIYDPLGYFLPVTMLGRAILQSVWKAQVDWDEEIPQQLERYWQSFLEQALSISHKPMPRFLAPLKPENQYLLACFADASKTGYAAAVYLRVTDAQGYRICRLFFARGRTNPIKSITIPRSELLAARIGARMINYIRQKVPMDAKAVIFTDSQCVLQWMKSDKVLKNFVQKSITEIKEINVPIRYVKTDENPADIATRNRPSASDQQLWMQGPKWLLEDDWPTWDFPPVTPEQLSDIEKERLKNQNRANKEQEVALPAATKKSQLKFNPFGIDPTSFSSLTKLLRTTVRCTRFIKRLKREITAAGDPIQSEEIREAKKIWEKRVQEQEFAPVFDALSRKKSHSMIQQLGIQKDDSSLLRCHGRLAFAALPETAKFPILLPRNNWFTTLVIRHVHQTQMHAGVLQTLAHIRQTYWIIHGGREVRKVVSKCTVCKRWDAGPFQLPPMPNLPPPRVTRNQPFTHTGLDYLGPLHVNPHSKKVWVCLFTCLTVRAIHLEVVGDLSGDQFLLALRRFMARRGRPQTVVSDNATNFTLVSTVTDRAWISISGNDKVKDFSANHGIAWNFITPNAPWMGGVYERMVQNVKRCLRKALGTASLNLDQLTTLLTEVEFVVNSRPLTHEEVTPGEIAPITPNHFLGILNESGIPTDAGLLQAREPGSFDKNRDNLLRLWKKSKNLLNQFWKLWETEYLLSLRQKMNWFHKDPRIRARMAPKVDDVVIVKTDQSRMLWPLAKIIELPMGPDGFIRTGVIQFARGGPPVRRSLGHLYPLEIAPEETASGDQTAGGNVA